MNRIEAKFKELRARRKKAFIAFITAGYPDLKTTEELVLAFEHSGVDLIELGVPFSDPLADGPTIQAASRMALKNQVNLDKILKLVKRLRRKTCIPIALMTYYNPVFHFGQERLIKEASQAGVDGFIIPDLPPEEAADFIRAARHHKMGTIFFLSPTTSPQRIKRIMQSSSGFVYFVSLTGVTGARKTLPAHNFKNIGLAKRISRKPVCIGFGISTPRQVRSLAALSDGVIVGSAIVEKIRQNARQKNMVKKVARFVSSLARVLQPLK